MAASTATENVHKIKTVGDYGYNLGVGLGIYEEMRDLFGKHGRRKATEIESGRVITSLHLAEGFNYSYYIGRKLSSREYNNLLSELHKRNSLEKTKNLASDYLQKALNCLESVVNFRCIRNIQQLHTSLEDSMNKILINQNP